ncbi:Inner membrane transport permease YbhS [Caloramator mitchellensis]|uniref:Transport permease protein n=2 Tax=Caloramator mitchellensis TaxID=908809 RepID=A0A0R3K2L0_CALMK|nr:Inner membrane transport permease YbhS [Caloramator mitchellensis]
MGLSNMNLKRMFTITKKEFIHIKRDKASLAIAIMMPIMMLILFGYAVTSDVKNVKLVVYDEDRTVESRNLIEKYANSNYFKLYNIVDSYDEIEKAIGADEAKVGLIIPYDFAKSIRRGETSQIQILVDGSDPGIARTAAAYSVMIANNYSLKVKEVVLNKMGQKLGTTAIEARTLVLYNPMLKSALFNVPGIIGLILQNITVILTAFAMVRERERGTIEQLIMTPVTSLELIIGKLIPYVIIGFMDFMLVLILGYLIFDVAVKGSLLLLILFGTIFLISALAMGMLVSTIAKTQLQAMQAAFALLLPSILLSGFIFPRESMPMIIYYIGNIFPITYFLEILRGIILKGIGIDLLYKNMLYLLVLTGIIVYITMHKFKKTLD